MKTFMLFALGAVSLMWTPRPAQAGPQTDHRLDRTFVRADQNQDGFLDARELAIEFRGPNARPVADRPGAKEVHSDHLFLRAWDANRDGRISRLEFERYEQSALAGARAANNRYTNYSRYGRPAYRASYRHRARGGWGNGGGGPHGPAKPKPEGSQPAQPTKPPKAK